MTSLAPSTLEYLEAAATIVAGLVGLGGLYLGYKGLKASETANERQARLANQEIELAEKQVQLAERQTAMAEKQFELENTPRIFVSSSSPGGDLSKPELLRVAVSANNQGRVPIKALCFSLTKFRQDGASSASIIPKHLWKNSQSAEFPTDLLPNDMMSAQFLLSDIIKHMEDQGINRGDSIAFQLLDTRGGFHVGPRLAAEFYLDFEAIHQSMLAGDSNTSPEKSSNETST